jgi:diphthine synthase
MTLTLISIGLSDEFDLSKRALDEASKCDVLYVELYTMILNTDSERLSKRVGRPVKEIKRNRMEEDSEALLEEATTSTVGIFVGGDALTATTHLSLLLEAKKKGIKTKIIHGSSIITAISETGLSLYKFGRIVTLPFSEKAPIDTVLKTLQSNYEQGLHTLILLDLDRKEEKFLPANEAAKALIKASRPEIFNENTLTIGLARLGWDSQLIIADKASFIASYDFGDPPNSLIVPGRLHFLEAEALTAFTGCAPEIIRNHKPIGEIERLISTYLSTCKRVLQDYEESSLPIEITSYEVKSLIEHAERYLNDAGYYAGERKPTALASVSYAEGVLDALRLLSLVKFEW